MRDSVEIPRRYSPSISEPYIRGSPRAPPSRTDEKHGNFKLHQARFEFYDRSSQYRTVARINNSVSKPLGEDIRPFVNIGADSRLVSGFSAFPCHFERTHRPVHHKDHRIIMRMERCKPRKKIYTAECRILYFAKSRLSKESIFFLRRESRRDHRARSGPK